MLDSDGYRSKNPTNETHVIRLYRAHLGRPADTEMAYWSRELDAGRQKTDTLTEAFAASAKLRLKLL